MCKIIFVFASKHVLLYVGMYVYCMLTDELIYTEWMQFVLPENQSNNLCDRR